MMKFPNHTSGGKGCQESPVGNSYLLPLIFPCEASIILMGIKEKKFLARMRAL
jgi:hypothetical protein